MSTGAAMRTHCGKWIGADPQLNGSRRLVCNLPPYHGGQWHRSGWSGWMWPLDRIGIALVAVRRPKAAEIVREWACRSEGCAKTFIGSEDRARVKGWKIETWHGDQMCPKCGSPDADMRKLLRDLERSVSR